MEFKVGEPVFLVGQWKSVSKQLYHTSIKMQSKYRKVLFIDTVNAFNIHDSAFKEPTQREIFQNIWYVRAEIPYDLLKRLKEAESFMKRQRVVALLINSLNLQFEDSQEYEIIPLLNNILEIIRDLTAKHNLVTLIGITPRPNENTQRAFAYLFHQKNKVQV